MPPFRIHQTRVRPERILIKLIQGKYIIPAYVAPVPVEVAAAPAPVPKKATTISLKQIKQIVALLQTSEHKDLSKLLSPEIKELLNMDEDKVDEVEEVEEVEEHEELDDEDVLIIDV
jgi:hypothetical protein